jgi:S-adenosylmethionine:tRNA ribosyltransferase-isomerase
MQRSEFYYDLPAGLIAQEPLPERGSSRLLCLNGADGKIMDRKFDELCTLLRPGDLLIFNNTRVIPARLFATKTSGGKVELLIERILENNHVVAQIGANKPLRINSEVVLENGVRARIKGREAGFYRLHIEDARPVLSILEEIGHVPIPPYVRRSDSHIDTERYQTVYASIDGAVAAPTAGLHFDRALMARLESMGVNSAYITLHIGAGTFQPVRVDDIRDHRMHREYFEVSSQVCEQVRETRRYGGRVVAVGTTVVRCLEAVSGKDGISPYQGETDIFIYPGYEFLTVDVVITNFHMPESTLLMLVCAFAGMDNVLAAYGHAVKRGYRFYSYGDAMFITRGIHK